MRVFGRLLKGLLLLTAALLLSLLFYTLVVIGDAPRDETAQTEAASLNPMPQAELVFSRDTLYQAAYYFDAPLLMLMDKAGYRLERATVREGAMEGVDGTVREVRIEYTGGAGEALALSSLTPTSAVRALPYRGFLLTAEQNHTLVGLRAVSMRAGKRLHVHCTVGDTLYQIEGEVSDAALRAAADAAQLAAWE